MILRLKTIGWGGCFYFYLSLIVVVFISVIIHTNKIDCDNFSELNNNRSSKSILGNVDILENIDLENEEEDEDEEAKEESNKFSWKDHNDDHGIYSERSLMSTGGIKRLISNEEELESSGRDEADLSALKRSDYSEKEWQLMFRSFDLMFDSLSASVLFDVGKKANLLSEIFSRLKPECRRDINHIKNSVKKHKLWALRMLDSNGKMPSGITYGRFSSPGDYEECLSINVDEDSYKLSNSENGFFENEKNSKVSFESKNVKSSKIKQVEHFKFKGKYCLIDFRLPMPERPKNKLITVHDPILNLGKTEVAKEFPEIGNFSSFASVFYEVGYLHGVCIPSSCDIEDLTRAMGKSLEGLYVVVNNTIDCEVRPDVRPPLRNSQIISITLLTLLFLNAFLASIVHHYSSTRHKRIINSANQNLATSDKNEQQQQEADDNHPGEQDEDKKNKKLPVRTLYSKLKRWFNRAILDNKFYLDCFSIQSNFGRLTKPDPRGLTLIHYTRIVAMALTVITHTGAMGTLQAITKPADASNNEQIFRDFIPQMLANAFTSIQIFFFMAGFMLVVSTYPSIKREKGHLSFIEYATKRAIRLMPGLAATIAVNFLWPLFVDGPMLSYFFRMIVIPCEQNWYRTLGFLSNFDHVEKMCIRHSYFSASDYQLHLIAFPLLILLYKQPTVSLIIATIITVAGFGAQVIMVLTKTVLPFILIDYVDKEAFFNVVHYIHHPVWNHMSAFFYGFIIGYLVVKQIRINLSEKTIKRIWLILVPIGVGSIFAPYFWNHYKRPIYKWQMVLYVLFDRFALLTTCAWFSYASMVLARPVRKKKNEEIEKEPEVAAIKEHFTQQNLPEIITMGDTPIIKRRQPQLLTGLSISRVPSLNVISEQQTNNNDREEKVISTISSNKNVHHLNTLTSISSLPRQRSSPDIRELPTKIKSGPLDENENSHQAPLKTSYSNINLSTMKENEKEEEELAKIKTKNNKEQQSEREDKSDHEKAEGPSETGATRKRTPVVSNINTLCLVLSRLTFQLYLFNMVVLWIDVNHSKYYWFFSYYFIITKAMAIYIGATIMATIFFVTLESPALTLYIKWIKSRAKARARRQQQQLRREEDEMINNNRNKQQTENNRKDSSSERSKSSPESTSKLVRPASQASGIFRNFDGLNMRGCTPTKTNDDLNISLDNKSITFIDLTPRDVVKLTLGNQQEGASTANNLNTKM